MDVILFGVIFFVFQSVLFVPICGEGSYDTSGKRGTSMALFSSAIRAQIEKLLKGLSARETTSWPDLTLYETAIRKVGITEPCRRDAVHLAQRIFRGDVEALQCEWFYYRTAFSIKSNTDSVTFIYSLQAMWILRAWTTSRSYSAKEQLVPINNVVKIRFIE